MWARSFRMIPWDTPSWPFSWCVLTLLMGTADVAPRCIVSLPLTSYLRSFCDFFFNKNELTPPSPPRTPQFWTLTPPQFCTPFSFLLFVDPQVFAVSFSQCHWAVPCCRSGCDSREFFLLLQWTWLPMMGVKVGENAANVLNRRDISIPTVVSAVKDRNPEPSKSLPVDDSSSLPAKVRCSSWSKHGAHASNLFACRTWHQWKWILFDGSGCGGCHKIPEVWGQAPGPSGSCPNTCAQTILCASDIPQKQGIHHSSCWCFGWSSCEDNNSATRQDKN